MFLCICDKPSPTPLPCFAELAPSPSFAVTNLDDIMNHFSYCTSTTFNILQRVSCAPPATFFKCFKYPPPHPYLSSYSLSTSLFVCSFLKPLNHHNTQKLTIWFQTYQTGDISSFYFQFLFPFLSWKEMKNEVNARSVLLALTHPLAFIFWDLFSSRMVR